MKVKIVKYETYPNESPTAYAVGFDIKLENGRGFYIDTSIPFDELESGMEDEEITTLAYNSLKEQIEERVAGMVYATPSIIGLSVDISVPHEEAGAKIKNDVDTIFTEVRGNTEVLNVLFKNEK